MRGLYTVVVGQGTGHTPPGFGAPTKPPAVGGGASAKLFECLGSSSQPGESCGEAKGLSAPAADAIPEAACFACSGLFAAQVPAAFAAEATWSGLFAA